MSDDVSVEELAEALLCLAKLITVIRKIFPADLEGLLALEDDLSTMLQEMR